MDVDEYSKHIEHVNATGYTSLLMSLGFELGLFDLMMKENRPVTSQELADLAGMKERYVREWLLGVHAGKMIFHDPERNAFYIPESHHVSLRVFSSNSGGIPVLASRTPQVKNCFKKDGPYGIEAYQDPYIWQWYAGWRGWSGKDFLDGEILPSLEKAGLTDKLESGISVLEVCCGSAELTVEMARRFPKSKFTGLDLHEKPLTAARQRVASSWPDNLSLIQGDVLNLQTELAGKFDIAYVIDSLHDLPDPPKAIAEVYKTLVPGGYFAINDNGTSTKLKENVGNTDASMYYAWSVFNCMAYSLSKEPRIGYGPCWGRENIEEAIKRNFTLEATYELPALNCMYICKK